jgi:hypothetical protein
MDLYCAHYFTAHPSGAKTRPFPDEHILIVRAARACRSIQAPSHSPHPGFEIPVGNRQRHSMMPGIALDLKPLLA